ncbi:HAMP domain-containing protein, partial [Clostridiaceae bacterium HSG29]|nr:HAMP domain-containing protein [Clostridiaceae bacterium HSG29]
MTIRKKIVLIYLIAIIIPAIIFTFTFRIINDDYKKQFNDFDKREINRSELINKSIINLAGLIIKKDYKLSDSSKEYLDEYLMQLPYGLAIDSEFGYYESKDFNDLINDKYEITYMDIDYEIFISHYNPIIDFQKKRTTDNIKIIAIFIILYIILHILFIRYVLKIILLPLKDMKQFAIEMKKGNYDYLIDYKKDDEIKEVYDAFENMRKRLKESEEVNIKYTENRKKLIANIGHDLKTPIAAISGYVDGIVDGVANTPEKFEKYVKIV